LIAIASLLAEQIVGQRQGRADLAGTELG
jgi:hypothetical protein